jgi:hypothetical protein
VGHERPLALDSSRRLIEPGYILIWFVLFPAFVTALIAYAAIVARGEKTENHENRKYPR